MYCWRPHLKHININHIRTQTSPTLICCCVLCFSGECFLMGTSHTGLNLLAVERWVRALAGETRRGWSKVELVVNTHISTYLALNQRCIKLVWINKISQPWHKSFKLNKILLKVAHRLNFLFRLHDLASVSLYLWAAVWKVLSWHAIHRLWNASPVSYLRETSSHREMTKEAFWSFQNTEIWF